MAWQAKEEMKDEMPPAAAGATGRQARTWAAHAASAKTGKLMYKIYVPLA
jgi:hypothetical protein